jgi:hypothetical protein
LLKAAEPETSGEKRSERMKNLESGNQISGITGVPLVSALSQATESSDNRKEMTMVIDEGSFCRFVRIKSKLAAESTGTPNRIAYLAYFGQSIIARGSCEIRFANPAVTCRQTKYTQEASNRSRDVPRIEPRASLRREF